VATVLAGAFGCLGASLACGSDDAASASLPGTLEGEIRVFAASSLSESFEEIGKDFETENPRAKVTFNFASSSALATQISEGAPADVFASADVATMKSVADRGNSEEATIFVRNTPVVVTPRNGGALRSFQDLAKPGVKLVLASKDVPIGRYARDILAKASGPGGISDDFSGKVLANLKSEEANVRAVLSKVQLGEADAGVVYVTDIGSARGEVTAVEIPAKYNVIADYPIAVMKASKKSALARAFVSYVLSEKGQAVLSKYGFRTSRAPQD
jgi:molybdate transport system substrate-binding protein